MHKNIGDGSMNHSCLPFVSFSFFLFLGGHLLTHTKQQPHSFNLKVELYAEMTVDGHSLMGCV